MICMGADPGIATGKVKILSVNQKEVVTAYAFLLNDFLLKQASEGAPFW